MAYVLITGIKPPEVIAKEKYRAQLDKGLETSLKKANEELEYMKQHQGVSTINCLENSRDVNGRCSCDEGYVVSGNEIYVGDFRKVVCIIATQDCKNTWGTEAYAKKKGDKYVCYL
jgi:uncharacterized protein (DUF927 family)